MTKSPTDYGSVALRVLGRVSLDGGNRETLIAKRENGTAHICALLLVDPKSTTRHARDLSGTALDILKYAGLLGEDWHTTQPRYDAGMRFGSAWYNGGRAARLGLQYQHNVAGGGRMSPRQQRHYEAWRKAYRALGRALAAPVVACCCFDEVPAESALPILLDGLDLLRGLPHEIWP